MDWGGQREGIAFVDGSRWRLKERYTQSLIKSVSSIISFCGGIVVRADGDANGLGVGEEGVRVHFE